jgi:hypothetical protein
VITLDQMVDKVCSQDDADDRPDNEMRPSPQLAQNVHGSRRAFAVLRAGMGLPIDQG